MCMPKARCNGEKYVSPNGLSIDNENSKKGLYSMYKIAKFPKRSQPHVSYGKA